jgi:hypothetical protein
VYKKLPGRRPGPPATVLPRETTIPAPPATTTAAAVLPAHGASALRSPRIILTWLPVGARILHRLGQRPDIVL